MWFIAGIGAVLAGLIMLARQGLAVLKARRTGVLVSTSYGAPRIDRAAEPEKFDRFMAARAKGLVGPAVLVLIGLGWLGWNILALTLRS
ncbi:hypothetical protein CSW58_07685 [Caulobacter sp. B11]|uniref:hypothetical protein n=1 Tax=Caulobacter sp. B11 TaxID=2048899 RepID=UPI000C12A3D6|nr:hypothetical protein [Caulobacter sp. B11]PHY13145.1 hypothetical protein CSW58_07685 [Caulobacter sp. B11]